MSLFNEIRRQPLWLRELLFGFSVIITISIVGTMWFHSFERKTFALINPEKRFDDQYFVKARPQSEYAPIALAERGFRGLRASIYGVLNITGGQDASIDKPHNQVYLLPVSGDRK